MPPPVVRGEGRVTLAEHLDLKNMPLAATPGGRDFVIKTLHPSEHTIRVARCPGGNDPSVAVCCDMVETIPVPTGFVDARFVMGANPIIPGTLQIRWDEEGFRRDLSWNFVNAAFGGEVLKMEGQDQTDAMQVVVDDFAKNVGKYLVLSQSVTIEHVAPSLTNQGTITAAQLTVSPITSSPSLPEGGGSNSVYSVYHDVWTYPGAWPNQSELLLGTSAYTAPAREGVYMPLKHPKMRWRNAKDLVCYTNFEAWGYKGVVPRQGLADSKTSGLPIPTISPTGRLFMPKMMHNNFAIAYLNGLSDTTFIRVRLRQVVELIVPPSTLYAPMLELALPPDNHALSMYYEISARMKDGYPASYNDLGKLRDLILKIGRKVAPYVDPALSVLSSIVPGAAPIVTAVRTGASAAGKLLQASQDRARAKKGKKVKTSSSTTKMA